MRIERLTIRNLRSIADLAIALDERVTVLVGTNNAGKTTVLDALAAVLGYHGGLAFSEQDFRSTDASASARAAATIEIELTVAPSTGSRFIPGELGQQVAQVISNGDERYFLKLATRWNHDPSVAGLESTLHALRADGKTLTQLGRFPFAHALPLHPFGSERDLRRGLGGRWSDWGRIVAESRPPPDVRTRAMKRLRAASSYLVKNSPGLDGIRAALGAAGTITGIGSMDVALSAVPDDVDELLRRVAIELRLPGAARAFAGERHGLGTQGALLFAVYRLHANRLTSGNAGVSPVMTLEEPETHLHPTAQRALAASLATLPGQIVVASHSPELLASHVTPILMRNDRGTTSARTSSWNAQIATNPRALFARCILIAEGLEATAMVACAAALGVDLHQLGVEVINAEGQTSIPGIWKTFGPGGFDIPVACLADGDVPTNLVNFARVLLAAGRIAVLPPTARQHSVLAQHAYFVVKKDRNTEEALVEDSQADVDSFLLARSGLDFAAWRSAAQSQKCPKNLCKRFNGLRGARAARLVEDVSTVADLTDREARVCRLSGDKKVAPLVLAEIAKKPGGAGLLPIGFRKALRWVERQTRST